MKKVLLITFSLLLLSVCLVWAQQIAPTGGKPFCQDCVPDGWLVVDGTPDIANSQYDGRVDIPWQPGLPSPPSGNGTFAVGFQKNDYHESLSTSITGLIPGKKYNIRYSVIAGKVSFSTYATTATLYVQNSLGSTNQTTSFVQGDNTDKWITKDLSFTAGNSTATIVFTGTAIGSGGIVGLDIAANALNCNAGTAQVPLLSTFKANTCPSKKIDLTSAFTGAPPTGTQVVWFGNPSHTGWAVLDPKNVTTSGLYYAFFYDAANDCYNTDNSTSMVNVIINDCPPPCNAGSSQVSLKAHTLKNICPSKLVDLLPLFDGVVPNGAVIRFYSTPDHQPGTVVSGSVILGQEKYNVGTSGTYYAFFYDEVNNCFNTDNSTASIIVTITSCPPPCNAGTAQVQVNSALTNTCPSNSVNLNSALLGSVPNGTTVYWYKTADHSDSPTAGIDITTSGTYYAFYYDSVNDCYNTNNSTAKVTVTIAKCCKTGTQQVPLNTANLTNNCPSLTADLGNAFSGSLPSGSALIWFNNPSHTGSPILNPSSVSDGTYYAFFVDPIEECYNTDNSTAKVTVTIHRCPPCNAGSKQVVLNANTLTNVCPSLIVDLKPLFSGSVPAGSTLVFYSTPNHALGTLITESTINGQSKINVSVSGTYYAFFYDAINDCFNTNSSTGSVVVTINSCQNCRAGSDQVSLLANAKSNVCPITSVNLNKLLNGTPPAGTALVWFNNPTHSGSPIADATQAPAGKYYAFFYDAANNCYNTSNSTASVLVTILNCCQAGTAPVILSGETQIVLKCPSEKVDLTKTFTGSAPSGSSIVWFTNALHSGAAIADPTSVSVGFYYAFFYDVVNDCYNTGLSDAKVYVYAPPQVGLSQQDGYVCSPATFNLNLSLSGFIPVGSTLKWFTNPNHTGDPVPDPTQVSYGTYYAFFYYETGGCQYNTDNSTSVIVVHNNCDIDECNAGEDQVILGKFESKLFCTDPKWNLNILVNSVAPSGSKVVWYLDASHTQIVNDPTAVGPGIYYAFFFDELNQCFNTDLSTSKVECIKVTATTGLNTNSLSNVCPEITVNLENTIAGEYGPIAWYTNPTHTGNPITDPTQVGVSGTYYAFQYDVNNCFNTDNSSASVTVTIASCNDVVQLTAKVKLQGSMSAIGTTMRNDLQNYFGEFLGLLPSTDPYGTGTVYANINNPGGVAGAIVDWVKVEVRSAANPTTILESKSLLLKPDGTIVDVNGLTPSFTPQAAEVHIVIKHRNHLAIMSHPIGFGSGDVSYDFTSALSQAFNDGSAPDQLKQINGVWCMVTGDMQQDLAVDNVDISVFNPSFNNGDFDAYSTQDLNLDGVVDNVDIFFFNNSYNTGYFSILINY